MSVRTLRVQGRGRRQLAALTSTALLGAAALAGSSASADKPDGSVLGGDDPASSSEPEK